VALSFKSEVRARAAKVLLGRRRKDRFEGGYDRRIELRSHGLAEP
jgi:hypothetical protein